MTRQLVSEVPWIGKSTASKLFDRGIVYVSDLEDQRAEDLLAIDGIGVSKAGRLCALDQDPEVVV
jgi:hypothetical protein